MSLTGGFDAVLRLQPATIADIVARAHAAGVVTHGHSRTRAGSVYQMAFGSPSVTLQPPAGDGRAHLTASTDAIIRVRPQNNPADAGKSATATITFRVALQPPVGNLTSTSMLVTDLSATTAADVAVQTSDAQLASDIAAAVVDLVQSNNMGGAIVLRDLAVVGVRGLAVDGNPLTAGGVGLAIGLDLGGGAGNLAQADGLSVGAWSLALSKALIVRHIVDGLTAQLGGVPPPNGTASVTVDTRSVCVIPTSFGCLATATQRVLVDRLDIDVTSAGIALSGNLTATIDGALPSTTKATFSTTVSVGLDATGQLITWPGPVSVTVTQQDVIGAIESFLTGTNVSAALARGLHETLAGGLVNGTLVDILQDLIAALSDAATGSLSVGLTSVQASADGLLIGGDVTSPGPATQPVAALNTLAEIPAPLAGLLNACGSWAPGSELSHVTFEAGDGTVTKLSGQTLALSNHHLYKAAGRYTAKVTVMAATGAAASATRDFEAGILRLSLTNGDTGAVTAWQYCVPPAATQGVLIVGVTANERMVPGIPVTLSGANWQTSGLTDSTGRVTFKVDPTNATAPGANAPLFALGSFSASATARGWRSTPITIWLIDCGAIGDLRRQGQIELQRLLDRLAEYTELGRIRDQLGLTPSLPGGDPLSGGGSINPPIDPRIQDARNIGLAVNAVTAIMELFAAGGGGFSVSQILGLSQNATPDVVLKKLTSLLDSVGALGGAYQQQYGPPGASR